MYNCNDVVNDHYTSGCVFEECWQSLAIFGPYGMSADSFPYGPTSWGFCSGPSSRPSTIVVVAVLDWKVLDHIIVGCAGAGDGSVVGPDWRHLQCPGERGSEVQALLCPGILHLQTDRPRLTLMADILEQPAIGTDLKRSQAPS